MGSSFRPATYYFLGLVRGVYPWYKEVHIGHVMKCMSRGRVVAPFPMCSGGEYRAQSHRSAPGPSPLAALPA